MLSKKVICPRCLQKGDKVLIVSPASKINPEYVEKAEKVLSEWGLIVEKSPLCLQSFGRFSGTVEHRLQEMQDAFDRKDIQAIFCSRGGYGCMQYLDRLDISVFRDYPKWLVGYSDITALHAFLYEKGFASLHAPMAKHLSEYSYGDEATDSIHRALFGKPLNYVVKTHEMNREGIAQGRLYGGNLSLLAALQGTKYQIPQEKVILFIEDIGEASYLIDRMIQTLRLGGVFSRLSGLIVGRFQDCDEDVLMGKTIYESIYEAAFPYMYPICFYFPVGHVAQNNSLICGEEAYLQVISENVIFKQKGRSLI